MVIDEKSALIIIDGQNGFVSQNGSLYVVGVEGELTEHEIITNIIKISDLPFGYLATSEDDHPAGHIEFGIFGPHCQMKTKDQLYHPDLMHLYNRADERLIKGENPDLVGHSIETSLRFPSHIRNLRRRDITDVALVGWAFTHCVGLSAIAYANQYFRTYVIRNATRSVPPPHGNPENMMKILDLAGVTVLNLENI